MSNTELRNVITQFVRQEVRSQLAGLLTEAFEADAPTRGRPRSSSVLVTAHAQHPARLGLAPPKPRGRRRVLSDEQRRANAAAYQRSYRARKKAENAANA